MTDDEIKQLIASNAKAIEALTNALSQDRKAIEALTNALSQDREERITDKNQLQQLIASNAKAIEALTNALSKEKEERITDKNQFQQTIADMQRQFIDVGRRTDSHSADIRELIIENQRILRYLESLVNTTGSNP